MFSNPEKNMSELMLREGMLVADLGAGSGFYSKSASEHVGHTGHVYAVEVQKDMVKKLESDLRTWGISNVDCIWGDIEKSGGTKIASHTIDRVIISNVLSQAEDKLGLVDEAKRILKSDGLILLIDLADSLGGSGIMPSHIVPESRAIELFNKRNLKVQKKISAGDHQYGIIFTHESR